MKKFYLTGHRTFGNRGCEAIVRSTVKLLREQLGDIKVLIPSDDIPRDANHWPEAASLGVKFVPAYIPFFTRYWANFQRIPIPYLKRAGWPFSLPSKLENDIQSVDLVLSIGGDNYSLDYRIPSLLMAVDRFAMDLKKPVILWGASVGPFEKEISFVPKIQRHLDDISLIAVRESLSDLYLKETLGLENSLLMADPAFELVPESVDITTFWPSENNNGVLGINISPVIERYRKSDLDLRDEVIKFIRLVIKNYDMTVLLVPHVIPLNGAVKNNDAVFMQPLLDELNDLGSQVSMIDSSLNAAQIKYAISQCRFFIGSRTHSTIAALSSKIPTISISYSIKAMGINHDLLGHQDAILHSQDVNHSSLIDKLQWLFEHEDEIHEQLNQNILLMKKKIFNAVRRVIDFL